MTGEPNDFSDQPLSQGRSQGNLFLTLTKMKKEGRFAEVIKDCLKALNFYPDDIRLRTLLAESYLEEGQTDKAEAELNRIVSDVGQLVSLFKVQARLYIGQQKYEEACDALKKYLAHNPDDQEIITLLAAIERPEEEPIADTQLVSEEVNAAIKGFEEEPSPGAPAEVPGIAKQEEEVFTELATPTLAEIYFNQGQIREAINTYEVVLSDNPNDEASAKRLAELKGLVAEKAKTQASAEHSLQEKRKKLASVLEGWLPRIRELKDDN